MRKQTAIWTCRDGTRLRICDMDDRHLLNAIACLERLAREYLSQEVSAAYSVACTLQGEMAQFYADQDIDRLEETSPEELLDETHPLYPKLLLERDRRGLPES